MGSPGNDIIYGNNSAEWFDGEERRDYINGAGGNDTIVGGLGNDILVGGSGSDTFLFGHLHDADRIQDFGPNDTVVLDDGIDHYFITEVWNGIRIATVDFDYTADRVQGSIVLVGVTAAEWVSWGGSYAEPGGYNTGMAGLIGFSDTLIG